MPDGVPSRLPGTLLTTNQPLVHIALTDCTPTSLLYMKQQHSQNLSKATGPMLLAVIIIIIVIIIIFSVHEVLITAIKFMD
jgi:hypothetical protein